MEIAIEKRDSASLVALSGHFQPDDEEGIAKAFDGLLQEKAVNIVVNMEGISSITSQGLSVLIVSKRRADQAGGGMKLSCLRPTLQELFEFTRLHTVFEIYGSDEEAIASFTKG